MGKKVEFKPCPFCNGKARFKSDYYCGRKYYLTCQECGAQSAKCLNSEEAVRMWNMREKTERRTR